MPIPRISQILENSAMHFVTFLQKLLVNINILFFNKKGHPFNLLFVKYLALLSMLPNVLHKLLKAKSGHSAHKTVFATLIGKDVFLKL